MTKRRPYSAEDDELIKKKYPWHGTAIVATELNRTECAINSRAAILGVRRVPKHLSSRVKFVHN